MVTIDYGNFADYRQLWLITQYKDGAIYKTVQIGFVKKDYVTKKDELLSPMSTSLIGKQVRIMSE